MSTDELESAVSFVPLTTEQPTPGQHLNVSVSRGWETDPRFGETYLLPAGAVAATEIPPRLEGGLYDFVTKEGGVPAGTANFGLTLSTTSDGRVAILSVAPRIVDRSTASPGALLKYPYGCGFEPIRFMNVDFDRIPTEISMIDPGSGETQSAVLSVSRDDIEVLAITASSTIDDVRFVLDIRYELDGAIMDLTVDDNGEPFRVTGIMDGTAVYVYDFSAGARRGSEVDQQYPFAYC